MPSSESATTSIRAGGYVPIIRIINATKRKIELEVGFVPEPSGGGFNGAVKVRYQVEWEPLGGVQNRLLTGKGSWWSWSPSNPIAYSLPNSVPGPVTRALVGSESVGSQSLPDGFLVVKVWVRDADGTESRRPDQIIRSAKPIMVSDPVWEDTEPVVIGTAPKSPPSVRSGGYVPIIKTIDVAEAGGVILVNISPFCGSGKAGDVVNLVWELIVGTGIDEKFQSQTAASMHYWFDAPQTARLDENGKAEVKLGLKKGIADVPVKKGSTIQVSVMVTSTVTGEPFSHRDDKVCRIRLTPVKEELP